jgi:hypothetical protein
MALSLAGRSHHHFYHVLHQGALVQWAFI